VTLVSEFGAAGGTGASGPRAGFGLRLVAAIIDGIVVGVAALVLRVILGMAAGNGLGLLVSAGYYTYFEGSPSGQGIGKRAVGIRVYDFTSGGPIGYGRAFIRWVVRLISAFACLIGYLWMLWDKEKQTWHDKAANCVVVPTADYPVDAWPG
jgi:uncharacterized RDD family membrane protein YckC